MRNIFREIWEDKRGNSLIIAAAALPLLLGSAGLATDTIQWALWKRQLQRAADSAAIAGVYDRQANEGATDNTLVAVNHDLTINEHTNIALEAGYPIVSYPADAGNARATPIAALHSSTSAYAVIRGSVFATCSLLLSLVMPASPALV